MNAERRRLRQAAWLLASATTVILVLAARSVDAALMWLLPLILLPPLVRWRAAVTGWWQLLLSLAVTITAAAAGALLPPAPVGGPFGPLAAQILLACLALMWLRAWLAAPYRGMGPTLALGLLAASVAGGAPLGWVYPVLCALYLGLALLALREAQPARARVQGWRQWRPGAALVGLSALVAAALAASLPPLYEQVTARAVSLLLDSAPRIRFTESGMRLGSLESVWQSDALIMRLHGASGLPYLRGSVHRRYADGRWQLERPAASRALTPAGGAGVVRVEMLDRARSPLFLPLGARLTGSSGEQALRVDALGLVRSDAGLPPARYAYRPEQVAPLPPQAQDLQVPAALRPSLAALAGDWLGGVSERPAARLDALQRRLEQDYVYSLRYRRRPGVDPVLDFLTGPARQGHCEYFASALALLARSVDVPARVVRGYRPTERNPWLGHVRVREADAHAWVEAWIDGRWQTRDPAPLRSIAPAGGTSLLGLVLDTLGVALARAWAWLWSGAPLLLAALAVLAAARWWGPRLRRLRGRRPGRLEAAAAPPALEQLLALLARRQLRPAPGETLERFAGRVQARLPPAAGAEGATLLRRYAAWRYGGVGSLADLEKEIDAFVRRP